MFLLFLNCYNPSDSSIYFYLLSSCHISHMESKWHLTHELKLCLQITRGRVIFSGDSTLEKWLWRQASSSWPSDSDLLFLAAAPSLLDLASTWSGYVYLSLLLVDIEVKFRLILVLSIFSSPGFKVTNKNNLRQLGWNPRPLGLRWPCWPLKHRWDRDIQTHDWVVGDGEVMLDLLWTSKTKQKRVTIKPSVFKEHPNWYKIQIA